ncbi:DUF2190 family protein [Marilutibacter spongiae]|uniref:DUF2190 family protein n=1 Tax=Marilutibacter spongiae TaxID=2025720 RepID=A0A7W3Y7E7_9GAMM|nr:capsid cement protein [Lysobacter spongiae]MBB1061891.1 DUF2190 family protein [Lysobacter spongiae]
MAKNFIQPGNVIDYTAGANLSSGVPLIVGILLAIPIADIANGDTGAVQIEGVWELPKLSTAVIPVGAAVNWDSDVGEVIIAAGGAGDLNAFGVAIEAAGNGATTVKVKLTPGSGVAGS